MKFLILGDTHFSNRRPRGRTDEDYFATQLGKLDQVFEVCDAYGVDAILQVGDFFDSPKAGNYVISKLITAFREPDVCVVYGQHDVVGHAEATFQRSPLRVMEAAGSVKLLGTEPRWFNCAPLGHAQSATAQRVHVYGASFGQTPPEVLDKGVFNVLVVHSMIGEEDIYPGQNIVKPGTFLRKYGDYNLICCGDYHYRFIDRVGDRVILNPGALVRKTVSERDQRHKPAVFVFDTETCQCEEVLLRVKKPGDVFLVSDDKQDKSKDLLLDFIDELRSSGQVGGVSWQAVLAQVMKERETDGDVRKLLAEVTDGIGDAV